MRSLSFNALPQYSPWPARLLGRVPFSRDARTLESLTREYEKEKYPELVAYLDSHPAAGWEEVREVELGLVSEREHPVSMDGELKLLTSSEAKTERRERFLAACRPHLEEGDTVLDLGAGYGYNLELLRREIPGLTCIGAEFSATARELGARLSHKTLPFVPFNLFDSTWSTLLEIPGDRLVILTSHAIEMMPDAQKLIEQLLPLRSRIKTVLHFEPLYERTNPDSLLGLLRQRYIEMNEYNKNLYSTLSSTPAVVIDDIHDDLFGLNPLFPESFVRWHFA